MPLSLSLLLGLAVAQTAVDDLAALQRRIADEDLRWVAEANPLVTGERPRPSLPALNPLADLARVAPAHARPGRLATWQSGTLDDPFFSWHDRGGEDFLTGVRDQGPCGSCFVFGAVGAIEGLFAIAVDHPRYDIDLSEQHVLSCIALGSCADGGTSQEVAYRLSTAGAVDEACRPYLAYETECTADMCADWQGRTAKITDWSTSIVPWTETQLKAALLEGPLAVSFQVYDDFYAYASGVYSRTSIASPTGWHVVVLVGWDDRHHSWIAKNSWSDDWGSEGYFEISRAEDCNLINQTGVCFAANAVTFQVDPAEAPAFPCLAAHTIHIDTHVEAGAQAQIITVENCGGKADLVWTLSPPPTGLHLTSLGGTLPPQGETTITLTADPAVLGIGQHSHAFVLSGASGATNLLVEVDVALPPPPVVAFAASPDFGPPPLTVTFTNQTTGFVSGYEWNFGDGATSTAEHPTHTYENAEVYTVTLVARWRGGDETLAWPGCVAVGPPPTDAPTNTRGGGGCGCAETGGAWSTFALVLLVRRRLRRR